MSLLQSPVPVKVGAQKKRNKELGHQVRVAIATAAALLLVVSIGVYGASYYFLSLDQRPYSPKHELLRPSGSIGIKLGILGTALFFIIFLYAFRRIIPWLGRFGTATHWMDFHVICGVTAPIVIAYHAAFKFRGIAGVAFWIMLAVALSGIIGRYLYSQIPRSLNAVELSLNELETDERELAQALLGQSVYSVSKLNRILDMPSAAHIKRVGPFVSLAEMIMLDIRRPFQLASLRRGSMEFGRTVASFGGLFSSGVPEVELVVDLVRQKASLSKRVVFLDQTRKVFHLWHVIHRPFSYAFAVLAVIHIVVVMGLGFMTLGMQ